jgi:hypothetical protein
MPMLWGSGTTMSEAWHDHSSTVGLARIASLAPAGIAQTITESAPEVACALPDSYGLRTPHLTPELTTRQAVAPPHRSLAPGVSPDVTVSPAAKEPKTDGEIPRLALDRWSSCSSRGIWHTQASNATRDPLEPELIPVPARVWTAAYLTSHRCILAISLTRPPCPALSDDPCDSELGLIEPDQSREIGLLDATGKPQGLPSERPRALGGLGYPSSRVIPPLRLVGPRLRVPLPSPENVQTIE